MTTERKRMSAVRPTDKKASIEAAAQAAFVMDKQKPKRLILEISPALHARIKSSCAARGKSMVKELTALLDANYP